MFRNNKYASNLDFFIDILSFDFYWNQDQPLLKLYIPGEVD